MSEAVEIRVCAELDEFAACVRLQREVWGFHDLDLVPLRIFAVASKIGGQVIGAFQGKEPVGFAMALPGVHGSHPYLHSHMLAVLPAFQNTGLGRRIKLFQRDDAIARGFDLMEWTFDPLQIKNAWFNLMRLGAIARRYNVNQYGITSSPLQGGLPTDRLVAEWWLKSERVHTLLQHGKLPPQNVEHRVRVPAEIHHWKAHEETRSRAIQVQARNRAELQAAFSCGLACVGYERDEAGNGAFLIGRWEERSSPVKGRRHED